MSQPTKQWGMTPALSHNLPTPLDNEKNAELVEELKKRNNYETQQETNKRMDTLRMLNRANKEFVKEVGRRKGYPQNQIEQLGGKIYPYGSYRLGVFGPGSDIDTLAVSPSVAHRDQFFEFFPDIIKRLAGPENVTQCTIVPEAFVPIIKLIVNGIEIDLIFAALRRETIPPAFELKDNKILEGLDEASIRAVTGPRVTDEILSLVPEHKTFRTALRAIKVWAQNRAIYGNIVGYPGGVAWAMLVTRVCQMYPQAIGATLVHKFFNVFKGWSWPVPVLLKDIEKGPQRTWNPAIYPGDKRNLMPIITPAYPSMCSTFNVTHSNKAVIVREIERGFKIAGDIFAGKAQWGDLFAKHSFFTKDHKYYLSIIASSRDPEDAKAWAGTVESKVRHFVGFLDGASKMVQLARPFNKQLKREHRIENEEQFLEVRKGDMKYKVAETKEVESTDPDLVDSAGAGTSEEATTAKVEGGMTVFTYTSYIGITPTALLEQTKKLEIYSETKSFRDKCYSWEKFEPDRHFLEVQPCRAWQLPDDLFDAKLGETKPEKPVKKRKAPNGEEASGEPPAKKVAMNGTLSPSATPAVATSTPQPA